MADWELTYQPSRWVQSVVSTDAEVGISGVTEPPDETDLTLADLKERWRQGTPVELELPDG